MKTDTGFEDALLCEQCTDGHDHMHLIPGSSGEIRRWVVPAVKGIGE